MADKNKIFKNQFNLNMFILRGTLWLLIHHAVESVVLLPIGGRYIINNKTCLRKNGGFDCKSVGDLNKLKDIYFNLIGLQTIVTKMIAYDTCLLINLIEGNVREDSGVKWLTCMTANYCRFVCGFVFVYGDMKGKMIY